MRDEVLRSLGKHKSPVQDDDYLVLGVPYDEIVQKLSPLGSLEFVGSTFGILKFTRAGRTVDIALPRRERSTGAHHRDFKIESSPDIPLEEDLSRRDFRINMMARDLSTMALHDPYHGQDDLRSGRLDILKDETFLEDPLRVLRGAHFAARFDLEPTARTLAAMRAAASSVATVAPERMADELTKLLTRADKPSVGVELLRAVGALAVVLPELMEGWGVDQNEFHRYTVYYHALRSCDEAPKDLVLRLAALLHDVGKPRTKSGPHFYRHELVGEEMARAALTRLRFGGDVIAQVTHLVRHHMFSSDDALSDAAVRRFINRVGSQRLAQLFALRRADIAASGLAERNPAELERFARRVQVELSGPSVFGTGDLAIDGSDVMVLMRELGLAGADFHGDRRVGEVLGHALECVLEDPHKNTKEALVAVSREYLQRRGGAA